MSVELAKAAVKPSIDISTLTGLMLSDLERFYFYNAQPDRMPRKRELWRNFVIPRILPVTLYRLSRQLQVRGHGGLAKLIAWINFYMHGIEISVRCSIGGYLFMPHVAGSVIGAAEIGDYAVLYHQVTLGATKVEFGDDDRPVVGRNVLIGSGAKVLGKITIGDDCRIGANSVVLKSLPAGAVAVGIPARIVSH